MPEEISRTYSRYRDKMQRKKRMRKKAFMIVSILAFAIFSTAGWGMGVQIYYKNQPLAARAEIGDIKQAAAGMPLNTPEYKPEPMSTPYAQPVFSALPETASITESVPVYCLLADGVEMIYTYDKTALEAALDSIKTSYAQSLQNGVILSCRIVEDIQIIETEIPAEALYITSSDDLVLELIYSFLPSPEYQVEKGDTVASIAKKFNITAKDLKAYNEEVDLEKEVIEGTVLMVSKPQPVLTVETIIRYEMRAPVPFTTKYIEDSSMYAGTSKV